MDPSGKKRKGGAERARDQKKAALQADATKCLKIADMFAARGKMLDSRWTRRP
jgi:hypothetical protein